MSRGGRQAPREGVPSAHGPIPLPSAAEGWSIEGRGLAWTLKPDWELLGGRGSGKGFLEEDPEWIPPGGVDRGGEQRASLGAPGSAR